MPFVRLVGDVHGQIGNYTQLVEDSEFSLQLGDMGYRYEKLARLDPVKHRFIPGNHDYYPKLPPHALGDYGEVGCYPSNFFIRGAYSVDKYYRTPGRDWFPEEELMVNAGDTALALYSALRPRVMFTHDCPESVVPFVSTMPHLKIMPSFTQRLLQACLDAWQPELWFFGHHHRTGFSMQIDKTTFRCLGELEHYDLEY